MPDREYAPDIADDVLWSNRMIEYDDRHYEAYTRLLDVDEEGVTRDDMARRILGIDPDDRPERARKAMESHLACARWMGEVGYRFLVASHNLPSRPIQGPINSQPNVHRCISDPVAR